VTSVELAQVLGDRTRLRILSLLTQFPELRVCDIVRALDLPQPTVSRHITTLRQRGFLEQRRDGVVLYCSLDPSEPFVEEKRALLTTVSILTRSMTECPRDVARVRRFYPSCDSCPDPLPSPRG
jgi:ArsR family transcriptional regulator